MHVSYETPEESELRLKSIIAAAELVWFDGAFAFEEHPIDEFPADGLADALAYVRDCEVWSVLKPAPANAVERFGLFSFHFPGGLDNSGFVGWLASRLKHELGTGVIVVCGQNSGRGGIYDYWGVPIVKKDETAQVLARLRGR